VTENTGKGNKLKYPPPKKPKQKQKQTNQTNKQTNNTE
jgi:hypothetical protein